MTGTNYLTYEQVVELNARYGGAGSGVREESGIRAQLGRAEASFGGVDLYPSLTEKAAILLHGLSSTQFFLDGNKRTAWIVADMFLSMNDRPIRDLEDVHVEAFVLSIATKAFENEDEPERGIAKAELWFEAHCVTMEDRYHFAFLAGQAGPVDGDRSGGEFNAMRAMFSTIVVPEVPEVMLASLVLHLRWLRWDTDREYPLRIVSEDPSIVAIVEPSPETQLAAMTGTLPSEYGWVAREIHELIRVPPESTHPHHPAGAPYPALSVFSLALAVSAAGTTHIRIEVNDEVVQRLPISAHIISVDHDL